MSTETIIEIDGFDGFITDQDHGFLDKTSGNIGGGSGDIDPTDV